MAHDCHAHHPAPVRNSDRWYGIDRSESARSLRLALGLTSVVMVAEFLGGLWTNSLALLADSAHMLVDAAALALSWFGLWFMRRPATPEKTYGYFRVEILAALLNGAGLVVIAFFILLEAYERLLAPEPVRSLEMLIVAFVGLIANLICAWVLHAGSRESLNVHGAFLHVVGDAIGSLGAILAGTTILLWQSYWVDPLVSVMVSGLILISSWRLVKDSVLVLLEGTPSHINLLAMKEELSRVEGVDSVHDLHVWTLTSGVHAMTCHAVVKGNQNRHQILERLSAVSRGNFNIHHSTIQIEEEDLRGNETNFCH